MPDIIKINEQIRSEVVRILSHFDPVGLEELDDCHLMSRYDRKFAFSADLVPLILEQLGSNYSVLEVEGRRLMKYDTLYFDSPGNGMYLSHHNGMGTRFKIRLREYADTGLTFLEIKHKNNRGEVIKNRLQTNHKTLKGKDTEDFIRENSPYLAGMLEPRITTFFQRFTLVNFPLQERITLDSDIRFTHGQQKAGLPALAMAEIKTAERNLKSPFYRLLRELRVREISFSKYCAGTALMNKDIRRNQFKEQLYQLNQKQDEFIESYRRRILSGDSIYQG